MAECLMRRRYRKSATTNIYNTEWSGNSSSIWVRTNGKDSGIEDFIIE